MYEEESRDQSPFFGGFALGVVAGAVGYYLLGTEEGRKVKDKIVKEWQLTRDEIMKLATESGVRPKPISLRALMVKGLKELHVISQKTKVALPPPKVPPKTKVTPKSRRSAPKKSELKFKGA